MYLNNHGIKAQLMTRHFRETLVNKYNKMIEMIILSLDIRTGSGPTFFFNIVPGPIRNTNLNLSKKNRIRNPDNHAISLGIWFHQQFKFRMLKTRQLGRSSFKVREAAKKKFLPSGPTTKTGSGGKDRTTK